MSDNNGDGAPDPNDALAEYIQAALTMAKANWVYYSALVAEGFTEQQAMELTAEWQLHIMQIGQAQ